jgi:hypothetical protein
VCIHLMVHILRVISMLFLAGAQLHTGTQLGKLRDLLEKLSKDPSSEVRSYLPDITQIGSQLAAYPAFRRNDPGEDSARSRMTDLPTFSRPPLAHSMKLAS